MTACKRRSQMLCGRACVSKQQPTDKEPSECVGQQGEDPCSPTASLSNDTIYYLRTVTVLWMFSVKWVSARYRKCETARLAKRSTLRCLRLGSNDHCESETDQSDKKGIDSQGMHTASLQTIVMKVLQVESKKKKKKTQTTLSMWQIWFCDGETELGDETLACVSTYKPNRQKSLLSKEYSAHRKKRDWKRSTREAWAQ